jgi:hypothetical protein
VRGNLFEKIDEAVFIGGGRDNLIEGNTFLKGEYPIHLDARGKNWIVAKPMEVKSDLQRNLEAVPYNDISYRNRYPHLGDILDDEPGMPKYNIARDNLVIGKVHLNISKDAESGISIQNSSPLYWGKEKK